MGDSIMATTVLDPLIANFGSDAMIDYAAGPGAGSMLLQMDQRINRVYPLSRGQLPWWLNPAKRTLHETSGQAPYDLVINLETSRKYDDFSRFVTYREFCGRPFSPPSDAPGLHAVELEKTVYRERLGQSSTQEARPRLLLGLESTQQEKNLVMLNPGFHGLDGVGYRTYRGWPMAQWCELATMLQQDGFSVLVNGTSREQRILQPLLDIDGVRSIIGCPIEQLARHLQQVSCLLTVDTGTMHLAAALGTPVLAMFGPTNPGRTGPYTRDPASSVLVSGISCQPCAGTPALKSCPVNRCMLQLTPRSVLDRLHRIQDSSRLSDRS